MLNTNTLTISRRGSSFIISLLLACSLLGGCASWLPNAHRPDVTQGVAIKPEQLAKLKPGMDQSDVTSILGNPTLIDPFHANRWDYIYRYIPGYGKAEESRVSLFFNGSVLERIDTSGYTPPVEHKSNDNTRDTGSSPDMDRDSD